MCFVRSSIGLSARPHAEHETAQALPFQKTQHPYSSVEPDQRLAVFQQKLEQELIAKKLIAKGGKYKPHITLFRQAVIPIVPMIEPIEISPTSVALFHSHRENNLLTYTVVCEKELGVDG